MKLRNLNGAIRGVDGPVKITVATKAGPLELCMVKSTLITNLKALYGDDNMVETGLFVDVDTLRYEDGSAFGGGDVHSTRRLPVADPLDDTTYPYAEQNEDGTFSPVVKSGDMENVILEKFPTAAAAIASVIAESGLLGDETLDIEDTIAEADDDLLDDTFEPKVHPQGEMADDEDLDDLLG